MTLLLTTEIYNLKGQRQFGPFVQADCLRDEHLGKNHWHSMPSKSGSITDKIERNQVYESKAATIYQRLLSVPLIFVGVGYLASYLLLDWASFFGNYVLPELDPWNPQAGLSLALGVLFGRRFVPLLFAGPLFASLVLHQSATPWAMEACFAVLIGTGYSAAVLFLLRPRSRFDAALSSMRDLLLLMSAAAVSSALVVSSYIGVAIASGLLRPELFAGAALSYWVGDMIGIMVVAPFVLLALTRTRPLLRLSTETILQFAAMIAALALMFGAEEQRFQLFYVLFLPIVWMALRGGCEGVAVGLLITQLGIILGLRFLPAEAQELAALQLLLIVLAATGLMAGQVVSDGRRTELKLRLHQESLARVSRIGGVGELALAMAHELNQPLTAARTYTRLIHDGLFSGKFDASTLAETAKKAMAQVERAAEVVRSLRALVRVDRSTRASCSINRIVKETLALCQPGLDRIHADVRVVIADNVRPVVVDILQVEQALLNLLQNSIEAMLDAKISGGSIVIEASVESSGFIEICVSDTGPGISPDLLENAFLPFFSTKSEGLGLGLPLCKSIIEAHDGHLWLKPSPRGSSIHFTLPTASMPSES